ncbi:TonB-dependent receptor plug domain-containing protein [Alteromonas sp. a30]|uniref:TonB-dependent receptor plug domain-containing protein n=1 Tax=Alteromonas sp. a30 TaxID=2730917 RepID=UPI0022813A4D|nr:TonB-dependent receptor [Alteromonas sp. a30]MCY7296034.1 TonB-dependent receptor [Alteromonas sp. a30]
MKMQLSRLSKGIRLVTAASLTASMTLALPAMAQEPSAEDNSVEKIAVVGTRSAPRSIGDSPVPVDIISEEEFRNQGSTDLVSMMQSAVPSFNVNDQPINDASTLVRPANLRGMASDHTLVLVNGKRRHRSAVITFLGGGLSDGAQGPDISTIPSIALKQVEVLRDGAAAQYGSDAIAGVVNFVLKDDAEGGSFEARYGSYYEGDGDTQQYSGNIGLPFTNNGFANFSFEYREADDTVRSVQRDDAADLIAGGNQFVSDPAQIWGNPKVDDDIKFFANLGLELNNNSEAYLFGNYATRDVDGGFYYRNPHTRGGVYDGGFLSEDTNGDGVVSEGEGSALLLVGDLDGVGTGVECPFVRITDNNVLDDADYGLISDGSTAVGQNCFAFNELFPGGFTPRFGGTVEDMSLVFGTRGVLDNEVSYDISFSFGENEVDFSIRNTVNPSLGPNTPTEFSPGRYTQEEKSFNLDLSKPFDVGLSEPLFLAGGFEYRRESYESVAGDPQSYEVGPLASQGFGIGSNGFPGLSARFQGDNSRRSYAFYLDSEIYIAENFLLGAAIRYEDFSDFGNTTKGKLSAHWQLTDSYALRGAYSTGFKAPTIGQSNVRNVTTAFSPTGLVDRATLPPTDPIAIQKGATPLEPEESTNWSLGFVAEFDSGLFVTVDYFNIELEDRISTTSGIRLTQEDIDTLLANGVTDASSFGEVSFFTNDFTTTTEGVDVVANYNMEMFGGDTRFALAYNWTNTEVDEVKTFEVNGETVRNISDERIRMLEDNLPPVRYSLTANHTNGDWRFLTRVNYFGSIFEDHLDSALPIDKIGSEFTVDLEVGYTFNDSLTFVVGAKNAFDEEPDRNELYDTEVAGSLYPTTSPIGINGGFYYVRGIYTF